MIAADRADASMVARSPSSVMGSGRGRMHNFSYRSCPVHRPERPRTSPRPYEQLHPVVVAAMPGGEACPRCGRQLKRMAALFRHVTARVRQPATAASAGLSARRLGVPRRLRSLLLAAVPAIGLLGLAGLVTPWAHADAVDDAFLNAVHSKDITFATSQSAIRAGHQVCDELDSGRRKSEVATDMANSGNLDGYRAGYFVGVSIAAYCPRHHHE